MDRYEFSELLASEILFLLNLYKQHGCLFSVKRVQGLSNESFKRKFKKLSLISLKTVDI